MLIGLFASFFLEIFAIIAVKSVSSQDSEYITVPAEPTFEDPLVVDASNAKATNSNLRKVLHPSYVKPSYDERWKFYNNMDVSSMLNDNHHYDVWAPISKYADMLSRSLRSNNPRDSTSNQLSKLLSRRRR
ncbi:hypothetical protein DdX_03193 [Ditylenchus destructor]|uniref:Uncharacterized protein n=1 Tax=Ditylenchus destructor TaxID=166010 RepID=A0AAD4NDW8_9BILA|nr:hypothetical protein DdX_03193 [Ditylenchus destructor]